jgi:hypothetical protein
MICASKLSVAINLRIIAVDNRLTMSILKDVVAKK